MGKQNRLQKKSQQETDRELKKSEKKKLKKSEKKKLKLKKTEEGESSGELNRLEKRELSFENLFSRLIGEKNIHILIMGPDAAGKKMILDELKHGEIVTTTAIINDSYVETVKYKNINFSVWDFQGQDMTHYSHRTHGLIFVVDCNDHDSFVKAKHELHLMMNKDELRDAVLLVFPNNQALPNAMSIIETAGTLELHSLQQSFHIQRDGDGLDKGLDWLSSCIDILQVEETVERESSGELNRLEKMDETRDHVASPQFMSRMEDFADKRNRMNVSAPTEITGSESGVISGELNDIPELKKSEKKKLKKSEKKKLKKSEKKKLKLEETEERESSGLEKMDPLKESEEGGCSKDFSALEIRTDDAAQFISPKGVTELQAAHATTLMECGNLYMNAAKHLFLSSASLMPSPEQLNSEYEKVKEKYNQAKKCYEQALIANPGLYKVLWDLGELQFMMAKFHLDLVIQQNIDVANWDSKEALELFDSAAENMEKWKRHAGNGEFSAEQMKLWGHMLFERSQVECMSGVKGWKENLDSADKYFQSAGISEPNILNLRKNHYIWNLKSKATSKTVRDSEFVKKIKEDEVKRRIQEKSVPTHNSFDILAASKHDDM